MADVDLDRYDRTLLEALQRDGSLSNAALAERVNLSASQVSRRRAALERAGIIEGYTARLNARALGWRLRAVVRIELAAHGGRNDESFAAFVAGLDEVDAAYSVSGDADYVLRVRVRDLEAFAAFVHGTILPHPQVSRVRSEIVLTTLKEGDAVPVGR